MLCEALTQLPHSIVFNEPNLALGRFAVRNREAELLQEVGVDLKAFVRRWSIGRRRLLLYAFHRRLLPALEGRIAQIGIKEIFHGNWHRMRRRFPSMHVVLTARDPRDIYLSLKARHDAGAAIWTGPFTPERVAASLNAEFEHQKAMSRQQPTFRVRYEDLCLNPDLLADVLDFVESEISEIGPLGEFLAADHRRVEEGRLHGGRITDKRVCRWRHADSSLGEQAQEVFRLMPDYCEFWQYAEDGRIQAPAARAQGSAATSSSRTSR